MFNSIKLAGKEYLKKPVSYAWAVLLSVVLDFIIFGALIGVILLVYYALSLFDLGNIPLILYILIAVCTVIYFVLMNGLKGALVNAIYKIQKERVSVRCFFKYALSHGETFFGITLIKTFISLILIGPVVALYLFVLEPMNIDYLLWLISIICFGIYGLIEFPFMYSYISAGTEENGIVKSIKSSLSFIKRTHINAFLLYFIYGFVWVLSFCLYILYYQLWVSMEGSLLASIVLVFFVLFSIFIALTIYPLIYSAAILFYFKGKK